MSAPIVTLDAVDAVELVEMLEFLHDWIGHDRLRTGESLKLFSAAGYTVAELQADLARFAFLLGGDGDAFVLGTRR